MKKTVLVLASLTVALGACSSSGGDDASSSVDTSAADASDTTDGGAGGEDPDNEFCQKFEEFDSPENQPSNQAEIVAAFDDLADAADDSIRDDLETVSEAFSELENLDPADPDAQEQFLDVLSQPEVVEAGENLEAYTVEVCGIEPEPVTTAAEIEVPDLSIPDEVGE